MWIAASHGRVLSPLLWLLLINTVQKYCVCGWCGYDQARSLMGSVIPRKKHWVWLAQNSFQVFFKLSDFVVVFSSLLLSISSSKKFYFVFFFEFQNSAEILFDSSYFWLRQRGFIVLKIHRFLLRNVAQHHCAVNVAMQFPIVLDVNVIAVAYTLVALSVCLQEYQRWCCYYHRPSLHRFYLTDLMAAQMLLVTIKCS